MSQDSATVDGGVIQKDIRRLVEHIAQVLPITSTMPFSIGDSPIERFWANVARAESKPFEGLVAFVYFTTLSLDGVEKWVAPLLPNSAILFIQMNVDGASVSREHDRTLASVRGG